MSGFGVQWHRLDHMQTICISLQTDNHNTSSLTGRVLFLTPNQQCQSTGGCIFRRKQNKREMRMRESSRRATLYKTPLYSNDDFCAVNSFFERDQFIKPVLVLY